MTFTPPDLSSLEDAAARCDWVAVRQTLANTEQSLRAMPPDAEHEVPVAALRRHLRHWWLKSAQFWWQALRGNGLVLRRTRADDAAFYRQCFANRDFAQRYNRQAAWTGDVSRALANAGLQSPVDLGAIYWIICNEQDERLGLASLTSINLTNARAEVSIGFPERPSPLHGAVAMLLIYDFAFFRARLNKLTSYVYTANEPALRNSLRVGLRQEGTLINHFYLPPGEFVDVHTMGLTRAQLLQDHRLMQMAQRRLGLKWGEAA